MFPADSGQMPQNKKKNRFKDILPCMIGRDRDRGREGGKGEGEREGGGRWREQNQLKL